MCLFRWFHLQGSRGLETRSLPVVNEQFSDKRDAANGTLWTDPKKTGKFYIKTLTIKKLFSTLNLQYEHV